MGPPGGREHPKEKVIRAVNTSCNINTAAAAVTLAVIPFITCWLQVTNVIILDENPEGLEGPWVTYARMVTLRTNKALTGAY